MGREWASMIVIIITMVMMIMMLMKLRMMIVTVNIVLWSLLCDNEHVENDDNAEDVAFDANDD